MVAQLTAVPQPILVVRHESLGFIITHNNQST